MGALLSLGLSLAARERDVEKENQVERDLAKAVEAAKAREALTLHKKGMGLPVKTVVRVLTK